MRTFLDIDFINWKKVPKWLRDGKKDMEKRMGSGCRTFAPNCPTCTAWVHFLELANFFEE